MSIPNEALQKLLQEIETRALASQQQIGITKAQMTARQRDVRMLQLTSKELSELPSETRVYEGVGKMFVNVPIDSVNKRLTRESSEASTEITNLEKKLQYHETTAQKSKENLEQILKSGGKA
ncbi:hypothetical protein N7532_008201 [Penicillium argentinense]|uniref:Prefoldin subunit 1 n=1 Tax=Penicillium argentinense TaxID=1131581 RepID=A0A9W9EWY8_9EURO|nr:uncharacterized protein N7532_008201 [Penicillium argentinense]KAJ5089517.1 hypothetical protein N7532_008201 [Penicillium argentinense]